MSEKKKKREYFAFYMNDEELAANFRQHVKETCGNMSWLLEKIVREYLNGIKSSKS